MYGFFKGSVFNPLAEDIPEAEKVKFLCSETYRKLLCGLARGLTNDPKAELVILPPLSQELGYYDGKAYYVCTAHEMYLKLPIDEITGYVVAVAIHEPFHGIYTDFAYWHRRIRSIAKGQSLYKWLFNAMCDARIERLGCIEFEGIKYYIVQFREFFFNNAVDESELSESQKLLNNILFFATCGKTKYKMNDKMQEAFDACRKHIISARRSDTTAECDKFVALIFDIVYPLVKDEQSMPNNPTGMMSNQKNGNNFKRNANSGGTDTITFDEDSETSDEDGEENSSATNGSGKSSKSKGKQSPKNGNSGGNSSSGDSDDDNEQSNSQSGSASKKDSGKSSNEDDADCDEASNANGSEASSNTENAEDSDTSNGNGEAGEDEEDGDASKTGDDTTSSDSSDATDDASNSEGDGGDADGEDDTDGDSSSSEDSNSTQGGGQGGDNTGTSLAEQEAENSKRFLRDAISGIASSYENEIAQKAQDEKRRQSLERESTYGTKVTCADPSKNNTVLYTEMVSNARPIIAHLTAEMKRVITWNQDEVCHKLGRGFLDPQSLAYVHRGTCFGRRIEKTDEADLFISMLVDCSGSMDGQRLMNTAVTVSIILEACTALKIPVSIKGFASNWNNCDIVHFWDYQYKSANCRENITQIYANGGTPLTEALRYEKNYLSTAKFADKICFVLTDGAPNNSATAIEAYKQLCNTALVYGVAIGNDIPCLQSIFGEGKFIDARDIRNLPFQIGNIIKKNILRR